MVSTATTWVSARRTLLEFPRVFGPSHRPFLGGSCPPIRALLKPGGFPCRGFAYCCHALHQCILATTIVFSFLLGLLLHLLCTCRYSVWLCVLHDNPPRRGTSKTLLIANNQAVMNQWLKELDKFFQNIPEWYTMVWCGDERWSAANAAKFKDAQVIMTTKDTVVSDFMAYSPYWMTDRSQNRDGTSCVMYSPVDGEPRPGQIDRKSGNEFDKSLISRRSEGRKKGRVSPLYARKQGHAVFDLIFVDEGDLLRVESEHTGPGQVKKRSWQVCPLPPSAVHHRSAPIDSHLCRNAFGVRISRPRCSYSLRSHPYFVCRCCEQAVWNLHCDRTWIMTGTPVNNNATGLLSLFELCRCGISLPARVQGLWTKDGARPLTFMEQVRRLNWYAGNKAMLEAIRVLQKNDLMRRTIDMAQIQTQNADYGRPLPLCKYVFRSYQCPLPVRVLLCFRSVRCRL